MHGVDEAAPDTNGTRNSADRNREKGFIFDGLWRLARPAGYWMFVLVRRPLIVPYGTVIV